MKYCTNCGNKLESNNNFCTKCGKEVKKEVANKSTKTVKEVKAPKDFNVNNLVLYVGVALVILSTFIFAICTWENMSGLFKISFLTFETLLFFLISFVFAKIKNNGLSKAFYMLAVLMIPVILYTIPVYGLLGNYLSYEGAGIFVYLAISNLLCAGVYLLSYFLLGVKAYAFISYTFIYAFIMSLFLSFERKMEFVIISTLVFILLVIIINLINNKDNFFRKSITWFTSILFSVFSVFMVFAINVTFRNNFITDFGSINLYLALITVLYLVDTFVFIYQNRKHVFKYVSPFVIVPVIFSILLCVIEDSQVFACTLAGFILLIYGLYLLFKDKYLKIAFKTITYIVLYFLVFIVFVTSFQSIDYFLTMGIIGLFTLGFNIINRFTEKNRVVSDALIPFSGILVVFGFIKYFSNHVFGILYYTTVPNTFLVISIGAALLVIYMILKTLMNKNNKIYYAYTMGTLFIAMLMCTYGTNSIYIIFLNALLLILFIFVSFVEKRSIINIATYLLLVLSILKIDFILDLDIRILFACISLISIVVGIILTVTKKKLNKFYLYFGEILALILSIAAFIDYTYILIALIGVLFVVCFISIILYNNTNLFRIIAEILGMILIFNTVNAIVTVTVFSSAITLFLYMVILVILGLTNKEKGWVIILLSVACLIPYYDFVGHSYELLGQFSSIVNQLVIIPFIVYLFVLTFYFKMKDKARMHTIIWPLMVFSTIAINTTTVGVIISLTLALAYIFIGIIKKYRYLVTFGIVYIFVTLVLELFKMFNNLALIIAVLVVGLALIIYVVINEVYKSKKNK